MLGELADGEALLSQFERLFEIEVPSWATEGFALLSCTLKASARSSDQLLSFLLCDPSEDRDKQLTYRTLGIEPRFAEAHNANAETIEGEHRLHVAGHRAPEAIERPNKQHIEGAAMRVVQELP